MCWRLHIQLTPDDVYNSRQRSSIREPYLRAVAAFRTSGLSTGVFTQFFAALVVNETVNNNISIMVIDDQAVVRQGFVSLINTVADMEVIAEGINGQQAIDLYRQHEPNITLIDLRMPVLGGVEAITAIRREFPDARLIVLTTYDGDEDIYRSPASGRPRVSLKRRLLRGTRDCNQKRSRRIASHPGSHRRTARRANGGLRFDRQRDGSARTDRARSKQ